MYAIKLNNIIINSIIIIINGYLIVPVWSVNISVLNEVLFLLSFSLLLILIFSLTLSDFISNNKNEESYIIQAAKMIYVGFSRPTHLLCYAVQKDNYENYLSTINHDEWNVMEI